MRLVVKASCVLLLAVLVFDIAVSRMLSKSSIHMLTIPITVTRVGGGTFICYPEGKFTVCRLIVDQGTK